MKSWIALLLLLCWAADGLALERRRDPFDYHFAYYAYPIIQDIPGLGKASGVGANLIDLGDTDLDLGGFYLDGEFAASGVYFLNQHLIPEFLVLDGGYYTFDVASTQYARGIDSDLNDYILPHVEGKGTQVQVTFMLFERMFEGFVRQVDQDYRLKRVYDAQGELFENVDDQWQSYSGQIQGLKIDYTDDRQDPRQGTRIEWVRKIPQGTDPNQSDYYVDDFNLSLYLPVGRLSTWAFNAYRSDATVTHAASSNPEVLRQRIGMGCQYLSEPPAQAACEATEDQRVADQAALNQYGRATPLGGTQRLRSYPNGRFVAGHTQFVGTEFRWNLNDENTAFDYFIMKGVRTGFQLAAFYEAGSVADRIEDLGQSYKTSRGIGLRVLMEGVTVRMDWATGEEGAMTTLFIDYPWNLSSVDNSTN